MSKLNYVDYVCAKCGAEDTDKVYPHEKPAIAVNCYKCKAGYGKSISEMISERNGMFPKGLK